MLKCRAPVTVSLGFKTFTFIGKEWRSVTKAEADILKKIGTIEVQGLVARYAGLWRIQDKNGVSHQLDDNGLIHASLADFEPKHYLEEV